MKDIQILWDAPLLQSANGGYIAAQGRVLIEWKRQDGNNFYETNFYVFPSGAIDFDVILGAEFISENNIVTVNEDAMLPLLESTKNVSPGKIE